jgi:hypothetical protein
MQEERLIATFASGTFNRKRRRKDDRKFVFLWRAA